MNNFFFEKETLIQTKEELKKYFKSDNIFLTVGANLICKGNITLGENVILSGIVKLTEGVTVEQGSNLSNVILGNENLIRPYSIISNLKAGQSNIFGPFCFVRDEVTVEDNCIIGAHVEITRSLIHSNVKISHHAFIGDATIESSVIVGANVVFCNFDGRERQNSYISTGVLLGSATLIISPIHVGANAIIAAGSIINKDVLPEEKVIQKRP
jgi:bifunctional UDP-N-acetylglucosamine pyrophosphorylase/glucosamine-1-phosphate N-acetyltransferase